MNENAKKFLDPKVLSGLRNFPLLARLVVDGFLLGEHRGARHAFSLEYSKHRDYYPGDPLKLVDWKLYGRTDRFFVKLFEEETNLECWIVIDISNSMSYGGQRGVSKAQYASYLSAAISHLLLEQKDKVGLIFFDDRVRKILPPSASERQRAFILHELANLKPGVQSSFKAAAQHVASHFKRRGMVILFSDLLTDPQSIEKTFKYFLHRGNDLIVFQVLTPEEVEFPFKKFGFFEDLETHARVMIQPESFRSEYLRQFQNYLQEIHQIAMKHKVCYEMVLTSSPLDQPLRALLRTREKVC